MIANCISVFAGSPVIKKLIKERDEGMTKVLKCAAEGFPKPTVQWSGNGSNVSLNDLAYVILMMKSFQCLF